MTYKVFENYYRKYFKGTVKFLQDMGLSLDDAIDVAQNMYIEIYVRYSDKVADKPPYHLAVNRMKDFFRKQKAYDKMKQKIKEKIELIDKMGGDASE